MPGHMYIVTGIPAGVIAAAQRRAEVSVLRRFAEGKKRPGERAKHFGGPGSLKSGGQALRMRGQQTELFVGLDAEARSKTREAEWRKDGLYVVRQRWRPRNG